LHTNGQFIWWHVVDGVARAMPDTADVRDAIDNGTLRDVYSSIEGAIIHGGVLATAFTRKTEATYDAAHWPKTGEHVRVGSITITKITAERARSNDASH
jgi:hypothetical protein